MVRSTESLERQLHFYETQSTAGRHGDDDASRAELQEVVAFGNFIYERIKHAAEERSAAAAAAGALPSEDDARVLENYYAKWCARAEADLRRAAELDAKGHRIAGLDRFRQALYEAKEILSTPSDRVRRSALSAREGRLRTLGEIRHELRRQADR
jgi:hypothetical protein